MSGDDCNHATLTYCSTCVACGELVIDFDSYYRDNRDGTKTVVTMHPEYENGYAPVLFVEGL